MQVLGKVIKDLSIEKEFSVSIAKLDIYRRDSRISDGVYIVSIRVYTNWDTCCKGASERILSGILHIGDNAVMEEGFFAEVHILDYKEPLLGKFLELDVLKRRGSVKRFNSEKSLYNHLSREVVCAKKFFCRFDVFRKWDYLNDYDRLILGQEAVKKISENKFFLDAKRVFLFAPTRNEINFAQFLCSKFKDKKYFFPKIVSKDLHFYESDFEHLNPGKFGILEPEMNDNPEMPKKGDFVFTPAVALDGDLYRLGRGGGYYDRILDKSKCHSLVVIPDFAKFEKVPRVEYDIKVDEGLFIPVNKEIF